MILLLGKVHALGTSAYMLSVLAECSRPLQLPDHNLPCVNSHMLNVLRLMTMNMPYLL